MNTELIFAWTVAAVVIVATVLMLQRAPRRAPLFLFQVLKATWGPERPAAWKPAPPSLMSEGSSGRRAWPLRSRVAGRTKQIQTAEWIESRDLSARAAR